MREILFRGKQPVTNEWVYGSLLTEINPFDKELIMTHIYDKNCNEILVNPETVGEYAGLTDKNGVKIFEGDIAIVFDGEYINELISYDNEHGAFVIGNTSLWYWLPDIEVIGNIYDNPELLEAVK